MRHEELFIKPIVGEDDCDNIIKIDKTDKALKSLIKFQTFNILENMEQFFMHTKDPEKILERFWEIKGMINLTHDAIFEQAISIKKELEQQEKK